jgi:hypothetical protein
MNEIFGGKMLPARSFGKIRRKKGRLSRPLM